MYLFGILIFLVIDGHHFVIEALALSFRAIPVGGVIVSQPFADQLVSMTGLMFVVAVKLAAPVLVALFLTNISLAVMARVMPQANIMAVSFPLTIAVGIVVLSSSIPLLVYMFKKLIMMFEDNVVTLMQAM
jgi:flagellar biosynthetic protein FliR